LDRCSGGFADPATSAAALRLPQDGGGERPPTAIAKGIRQEQWSFQLARFLQGQALDVYQRMTDDDVGDYDLLKNSLLKRFGLTEGGHRKRFKSLMIEVGETAEQFVDRLKKYLTK